MTSTRPTHPLQAWRETQTVADPKGGRRAMSKQDAADACSVPYQTYRAWELYPDESGHRLPSKEMMDRIFRMTKGQVRPDHFYDLPGLRGAIITEYLASRPAAATGAG